jgi:nicotinamidase-related amidase
MAHKPSSRSAGKTSTAVLVVDMLSDFRFPDADKLLQAALSAARHIERLAERARQRGVPVIYVNDNLGLWRSDLAELLARCARASGEGAEIVQRLRPQPTDYIILKPKQSGFYATPLDTLLQELGTRKLVLTGVSSDQCVLFTANDAYLREYELCIPRNCLAGTKPKHTRFAVEYFKAVLRADVRASSQLRLP